VDRRLFAVPPVLALLVLTLVGTGAGANGERESLVRLGAAAAPADELRELGSLRRDLQRRAALGGVAGGLVALAALDRLGPARVSQVADELQVDLSVASRQVAALHTAGYVRRVPDPQDGRSQKVKLTALESALCARPRSAAWKYSTGPPAAGRMRRSTASWPVSAAYATTICSAARGGMMHIRWHLAPWGFRDLS